MRAAVLVLGFPYQSVPPELPIEINHDSQEVESVDSCLADSIKAAQIEVLQSIGFEVVRQEEDLVVMQQKNQLPIEFRHSEIKLHWNREDDDDMDEALVGVAVAAPYFAHLVDYDMHSSPTTKPLALTTEKLALVEKFKNIIAAKFPVFSSATLLLTVDFF